jgi:hypothetical protein
MAVIRAGLVPTWWSWSAVVFVTKLRPSSLVRENVRAWSVCPSERARAALDGVVHVAADGFLRDPNQSVAVRGEILAQSIGH